VPATESDEMLRRIEALTDVGLSNLDVEGILLELLDRVRDILSVDTAAVLLLDERSGDLIATAARGIEEEVRQDVRIPLGRGFAGRVAAERRPVVIDHVDETTVINPILRERGISSMLGVPMIALGRVIGVLHVGTLKPRRFTPIDTHLLQLAGDRIAVATRARLSSLDRAAALALQRSLLPPRLPPSPGIAVAARYVPGHDVGVGGDWYDLFSLPSGSVGFAIGDVTGHGLAAAVVMGRLRSALRAYALESDDPADVLARLDRKVDHFEHGMMATVLYGVIDPTRERLRLSCAGHPVPVMAAPDSPVTLIELHADPPVGVGFPKVRNARTVDLPDGAVVVCYTDGLVERRGEMIDVRISQLRDVVTAADPETVCSNIMAKLIGGETPRDDIAVLAIRRTDVRP
jgi:putative methionine-R-sulfoxide reductase with GAF domain